MKKAFNDLNIEFFLHCALCLKEKPKNQSPKEYQNIEVGWTRKGLQIWCTRHQVNVIHLDFEGRKIKADISRKRLKND